MLAFVLALAMMLTCSLALADRLDDILAAGKLTIATSPDWPPYEYIDDEGNVTGTDVLMAKWMAEQLGVELEIQSMAFDTCLAAVGRGDVDMMVAGLTYDEERTNAMDLTGIYWNEGDQGLLVRKGERVCIIGDNGIGKTTLLKILMGLEKPDNGYLRIGYNVNFGYYDQGQLLLDENETQRTAANII